jgi:toxin ParE1/3/4
MKMVQVSGIRRIDLARFPYAIFFWAMPAGDLQVTAFAHHRRRPGYWLTRIAP